MGVSGGDREQAEVRDPFSNQPFKKSLLLLVGNAWKHSQIPKVKEYKLFQMPR